MWAKNIVVTCMNVSPGEKVLLITDQPLAQVREWLSAEILARAPAEFWMYTMPDATRPIESYPPLLHELVKACDAIIRLRAYYDVVREFEADMALQRSRQQGRARMGSGSFIDQSILDNELSADYNEIAALTRRLANRMAGKKRVHITAPAGTDLTFSIAGREVKADTGLIHEPGQFGNLPAGEVYTAPLEDSANGVLVVDKSFSDLLVERPVRMTFVDGCVISIEGGAEAEEISRRIEEAKAKEHGEWCEVIGELGIGTNPKARLMGNIMTDEKVMGTVHIAVGNNTDHPIGGINPAPIHLDGVVGTPTLVVDDEVLIEGGRYLV